MKKHLFLPLILLSVLLFCVPAAAEIMYAANDTVPVLRKQDINSEVAGTYRGGDRILIEGITPDLLWASTLISAEDGEGQTLGWIPMSALSYTMPSRYCSHNWTEWQIVYPATCTSTGLRQRSCTICGVGESQEIGLAAHSFGPWTVTKQADCISQGQVSHRCAVCGFTETAVVEKTPHSFSDWTVTKEATCTAEGERYHRCRVCGLEERQKIEKLPHSFGEPVVTKDPTCTEEGIRMRRCQVCGFEAEEPIEKLPHDFEWQILVEATDHSSGIRTNTCKVCGFTEEQVSYDPEGTLRRGDRSEEVREVQQLLADQNYLGAGGADGIFGAGTEKAIMAFQNDQGLTVDGIAWPQTIQRLHHDFNPWETITKLTRTEAGEMERSCKDCNYVQHQIVEPQPSFKKGDRGEAIRSLQMLLTALGHNAGTMDGIYGSMLDAAFKGFAADNNLEFKEGTIDPAEIDSLVNAWITSLSKEVWMGEGGPDSPVCLALTVNPMDDAVVPVPESGAEEIELEEPVVEEADVSGTDSKETAVEETGGEETTETSDKDAAWESLDEAGVADNAVAEEPAAEDEPVEETPAGDELVEESSTADELVKEPSAGTEPAEDTSSEKGSRIITCNYTLTNLGYEDCTFIALLLNLGSNDKFTGDNLVMILDGTTLKANCGNDIQGTFYVSEDWGAGEFSFCALAVSNTTGDKWLSNVDSYIVN